MKTRTLRTSRGFTLLEILVALALFGLIVAAMYSSWLAIVRGSRVAQKAAANVQRSRIAMRTLEEALMSVQSYGGDIEYYSFDAKNGPDASLSFVAKLPASFLRGGRFGDFNVRRVTFSVEQGGNDSSKELVMRQRPLLMDMDIDEKQHPVVLARDVKDFKMAFWDLRNQDWVDEWTQTNQLPPMIQFTLKYGGESAQHPFQAAHEVTRVVSLPAMTVPPGWQAPGARFQRHRIIRPGR